MDSFLDDYHLVRMVMVLGGFAHLAIFSSNLAWQVALLYTIGLSLTGAHALWSRLSKIRSPLTVLVLDLTVWGGTMVLAQDPTVSTSLLAFLAVLSVLFSTGRVLAGFLAYAAIWYSIAHFRSDPPSFASIGSLLAVLLIIGGLAAMIIRVRRWLARIEVGRARMLGTVSHELRNSLTATTGLLAIVSNDPTLDAEESRELVALAHHQAVDASEIIDDLLIASRVEGAVLKVATEAVNLNQEVEPIVRRFSNERVELIVQLAEDLPAAVGDGLRVRQIARNLVSNAVRYGGTNVLLSTYSENGSIQLVVRDDGDGVPPQDEATIFLPYHRSTPSHHAESVGLGLWISRELAHAMDGTLEYRRTDGATEFVFTLRKWDPQLDPGSSAAVSPGGQSSNSGETTQHRRTGSLQVRATAMPSAVAASSRGPSPVTRTSSAPNRRSAPAR
ncbi:MAG: HAMP domain-containing sensor histidine kinase [Acidimicrobiia bacterium]